MTCHRAGLVVALLGTIVASAGAAGPRTELDPSDVRLLKDAGLAPSAAALLRYVADRVPPEGDPEKIPSLIDKLGDDSFEVREAATVRLIRLGPMAVPALRTATHHRDPEIARRAAHCLPLAEKNAPDGAVSSAAARALGILAPPGTAETLLAFLPFAENDTAAEETRMALAAVAYRSAAAEKALRQALAGKVPLLRAAAAEALVRAGDAAQPRSLRRLLADDDVRVRLAAAQAMAGAGDREAIPALIQLLKDAPAEQVWSIEEIFQRVAGEQSPLPPWRGKEVERNRYATAWGEWWRKQEGDADLKRLRSEQPALGFLLVAAFPAGDGPTPVMELDREGKVRWQFQGPPAVTDARVVGGNRVLVAERDRVTERTFKGEVVWKYDIKQPVACHRLHNGNVFIASGLGELIEVHRSGKVISRTTYRPAADLQTARRLRNGETVVLAMGGRLSRLDARGNEVSSVRVYDRLPYRTTYDLLADGRLVMPQTQDGKVVEYDAAGKVVWEAVAADLPTGALRCGTRTFVLCAGLLQEVDRTGKVLSQRRDQSFNGLLSCR
jgi:hypothetical protein